MAEPALSNGQYSIGPPGGPALVYGYGTVQQVTSTATDTGSINVQDVSVVGQDGLQFGVDTMPGMLVTQSGQCYTSPGQGASAMDAYDALAGAWNAPATRLANGAVQVLRAWYPGSLAQRRCYGRGRKIMPVMGGVFQGLVPWTGQFQAADGIWYSETEYALALTTIPSYLGGVFWPVTPPFQWAPQTNTRANTIVNSGPQPTWPVITFTGPVTNPSLLFVNTQVSVGITGVLAAGSQLVIDTRPWFRTALLNGASAAGLLTGSPMSSLQVLPGSTLCQYGGTDFTGTSTCVIKWRNAHLSIGGSS